MDWPSCRAFSRRTRARSTSTSRWTRWTSGSRRSCAGSTSRECWSATARCTSPSSRRSSLSSRADVVVREREPETWFVEVVRTWAFAHRNVIMARRNVFFVFEMTFWPGVAMLSHGLLTRFLDLTPAMTSFILVGTMALSAVQVCQLDVAYAMLRSEEHTSELQSPCNLVCRLL